MHPFFASAFTYKGEWGEKFKNDPHGEQKLALIRQIEGAIFEIKAVMDAGLSSEEYEKHSSVLRALLASIDAVESIWLMQNG